MRILTFKNEEINLLGFDYLKQYEDKNFMINFENCKLKNLLLDADNVSRLSFYNCCLENCKLVSNNTKVYIKGSTLVNSEINSVLKKNYSCIVVDASIIRNCNINEKTCVRNCAKFV